MNGAQSDGHDPPFRRVEDEALVSGKGRFVDDAAKDGVAHAAFVRSPHAHARIISVDAQEARKAPGVLAVMTAADVSGFANISRHFPMHGRSGSKLVIPHRPALATDRVLHVGQAIAAVIAETPLAAQDAADLVAVEYAELPSVVDVREAARADAPQLWPEAANNIALDWPGPVPDDGTNAREIDRIMAQAAHVARVAVSSQRLVVASMEPRGATGAYDPASDSYTMRVCSQGAGPMHDNIAAVMGVSKEKVRVITEDVGGAFGMKSTADPEHPVLLVAARRVGRPVHWMSKRSEAFVSDQQGRDCAQEAELALDERGRFLALRVRQLANLGAYIGNLGAHIQTNNFARCFPGLYRIPRIEVGVRCVFTNTVPTGPYRGAGRPEANYLLERVVEEAARVTGIDPAKLRRRNLIPPSAMPYKTAVGTTYDSGDFPALFEQALELAGHAEFRQRRREARKRGKYRGIGISCFLEHSGGTPTEGALLVFLGDGTLMLGLGVQSTGQGHATVFPRLVAERLGIKPEQVRHRHGDSSMGIAGTPSVASRSAITAGGAIVRAVDAMVEKGKKIAAHLLEAAEGDIQYRNGSFAVVGTDRGIGLFELGARAAELAKRGEIPESLDTKVVQDTPQAFPNGCHVAEVEIDPATGTVEIVAYTAVDDCGNVLDHTIVTAQVQGGVAQGLGQALLENAVYEPGSGQLITGSFMDYATPRAHDMPRVMRDTLHPVPATTNPLGVKGVGEAGTTASLAAIMNAIADAVPAAAHMDMPATNEKVWRACRQAVDE
jgi:carbon-monoxide dehydrogenase large subunit